MTAAPYVTPPSVLNCICIVPIAPPSEHLPTIAMDGLASGTFNIEAEAVEPSATEYPVVFERITWDKVISQECVQFTDTDDVCKLGQTYCAGLLPLTNCTGLAQGRAHLAGIDKRSVWSGVVQAKD